MIPEDIWLVGLWSYTDDCDSQCIWETLSSVAAQLGYIPWSESYLGRPAFIDRPAIIR